MFTDYRDKNSLIVELFLDYGKNPQGFKDVIANYCTNLSDIDYDELESIINKIKSSSDKLPKWMDIQNLYNSEKVLKKMESVEWDDCNRSGVIYGIRCGINIIKSLNYPNYNNEGYYTTIIGRCSCDNGLQYQKSMPIVEIPKFIKDYAKKVDDYPNVVADELCNELIKKSGQDSSKNTPRLATTPILSWLNYENKIFKTNKVSSLLKIERGLENMLHKLTLSYN